jgi:hypothetical protein
MYMDKNGAGDEVRTHDPQLGRLVLYQLSYTRSRCFSPSNLIQKNELSNKMVARAGFEPAKADAGRFTVCSL